MAASLSIGLGLQPQHRPYAGPPPVLPDFFAGLATGGEAWAYDAETITADAALCAAAGAYAVRMDLCWDRVEVLPGIYDWSQADRLFDAAAARGLRPLFILQRTPAWARGSAGSPYTLPGSPLDFAAFCRAAVQRYRDRGGAGCRLWQIWNEPNTVYFNEDPLDVPRYAALLRAGYSAIKAADPGALVLLGGILRGGTPAGYETGVVEDVTWLEQLYQAGGGGYFDVLAYHPYCYPLSPAEPQPDGADVGPDLIPDGGFEAGLDGWTSKGGMLALSSAPVYRGAFALYLQADGSGQAQASAPWVTVTPGEVYHFSARVCAAASTPVALQMDWFSAEYAYLSSSFWDQRTCPAGEWVPLGCRAQAPQGAAFGGLTLRSSGPVPAGTALYFDEVRCCRSSSAEHGWNRLAQMRAVMAAHGDGEKRIWLTEYGQPTGTAAIAVSEAAQADYIRAAFERARGIPGVQALFIHRHRDPGTDPSLPEHNFGLARCDYSPKPAFTAFQECA
ncbi:MAG: hypothetical protein GX495_14945 [Chloroflexi bacterium]|nr:hypothetical protein [Chloroflexota bacterium]